MKNKHYGAKAIRPRCAFLLTSVCCGLLVCVMQIHAATFNVKDHGAAGGDNIVVGSNIHGLN